MLESGQIISHYKIIEKLGQGGMGVVYKATDLKLGRTVALKFLPHQVSAFPQTKERFVQEAQAASSLNHNNIVTIYEIDQADGQDFISMEFIDGKSLKEAISSGQIPTEEVVNIALQVAEGLLKAHQKGIIHRDIKSENILLTGEGIAKITDFGLAKLKESRELTITQVALGTAAYMSPEQAQGEELDLRSDIFSLGVVLYELSTGQLPFSGMHQMAIMYSIINEEPPPPCQLRDDFPKELEDIILRCLEKDKNQRYQNLGELIIDLKGYKEGTGPVIFKEKITTPGLIRLAVLPFEDLSFNKENEYFSNGMMEELITDLSKISQLKVTPRATVMRYKEPPRNLRQIGKELKVDYVLEGSVRKQHNKLRITVQLSNTKDSFQMWAEKYDGDLEDVFAMQEKLSRQIAQALEIQLTPKEIKQIAQKPTASIEAYDFYLKGQDYYYKEGKTNIDFAMRMYEKALEKDSQFGLAYTGLADAYVSKYMSYIDRNTDWLKEAERACRRALSIDNNLPEAHRALGRLYMFERKNQEAVEEFKKAIQLKPDYHDAYRSLGWIYVEMHLLEEAINWGKKALELKPMDKETYLLLGLAYFDSYQNQKAKEMYDKALEIAPDYGRAYYQRGAIYQREGSFKATLAEYRKALEYRVEDPNIWVDIAWVYLLEKEYALSIENYKKAIEVGYFDFLGYYFLGVVYQEKREKYTAQASFESAEIICKRKISEDAQNPYLFSTLGLACIAQGKHNEGRDALEKAFLLDSENGAILFDLARGYALLGDEKKVLKYLKEAFCKPLSPSYLEASLDPHFILLKEKEEFKKLYLKEI